MKTLVREDEAFRDTVKGLIAGDFSRLEPLFEDRSNVQRAPLSDH